jgi:hypothetical protein
MGVIASNCQDNRKIPEFYPVIGDCLIWPGSMQTNFISKKRAPAPVVSRDSSPCTVVAQAQRDVDAVMKGRQI